MCMCVETHYKELTVMEANKSQYLLEIQESQQNSSSLSLKACKPG